MIKRIPLPWGTRRIVKDIYNHECAFCGRKRWLDIHHIDHDPSNNELDNLMPLCILCHYWEHPNERMRERCEKRGLL